jgi:hypothetical protein
MRHFVKLICFALLVLLACSDEGGSLSNSGKEGSATFLRLHESLDQFLKIQEPQFLKIQQAQQFSDLSSGLTFENDACGSAFITIQNGFGIEPTNYPLANGVCLEESFGDNDDPLSYFLIFNSTPLGVDRNLIVYAIFFGGRPSSGDYDLNCWEGDCDDVQLLLRVTDSWGGELAHYHGMPNVLTVKATSSVVTASFDGYFYSDFFDEPTFTAAGTLVCCGNL